MCASSTAGANGTPAGCWSWGDRRIAIGPKNPERDTELRSRLKQLVAKRMRFGYRRLTVLLAREGMAANHKRVYRLYREERLAMRVPQRRRLRWNGMVTKPAAVRPNQTWSIDFVNDCVSSGKVIRILTLVDE